MDQLYYKEMVENLNILIRENTIQNKRIYLFGHCNATEELANLLQSKGFTIIAILDNNSEKQGKVYQGIPIQAPRIVLNSSPEETVVCIVARAYASMADQLKRIGFKGKVRKLVDYNTYAEYSLSSETIIRKQQRVQRGMALLRQLKDTYPGHFIFLCPFSALGDIYFTMSYLPYFIKKRKITKYMIAVIGNACIQVVRIFDACPTQVLSQKDMDETVQAALYLDDPNVFIPHQDRPYVVNLSKALYVKLIPLEKIYCCGVFGLLSSTKPYSPTFLRLYDRLEEIKPGKSVIVSPYAKSVTALNLKVWKQIIEGYLSKGYICYTNVVGEEKPLPGTYAISPNISEMQSVVERAGLFIGIRSGLCDVIREASCEKIALYPDYQYCDTKWKAIDMYWLDGWENIVVGEEFQWNKI